MSQIFKPKSVTANDLLSGDVIYLTADWKWGLTLDVAAVYQFEDDAAAALSCAEAQPEKAVGAYLIDVAVNEDGQASTTHFREEFRASGPSNYFHGKQEQLNHV